MALRIFFRTVTWLGTPFFYIPLILYLFRANKSLAVDIVYILILLEIVCCVIKFAYPKERPIPMKNKTLWQKYRAGSFPSVHTARISAVFAAIALSYKDSTLILTALLAVACVAYSRVYLKKHYAADVIAGFFIGAFISALFITSKPGLFFILQCIYLMLPAYFANMSPVIFRKINFLDVPVDFGKKISNKPLFGKNKTFRGFFFGIVIAIMVSYFQFLLFNADFFSRLSFTNYGNWILFGFFMGFGALTGDLVKSFFKRRIGIKPGHKFIPFDQTDLTIGSLLLASIIFDLTLKIFIACLLITFVLDVTVNHIAFHLKIRNEAW